MRGVVKMPVGQASAGPGVDLDNGCGKAEGAEVRRCFIRRSDKWMLHADQLLRWFQATLGKSGIAIHCGGLLDDQVFS